MAVYRRTYRPWQGAMTPEWSRFLILPRYTIDKLLKSKILAGYLVLCLVPALVGATIIWFYNNPIARTVIGMRGEAGDMPFAIDGRFFLIFLSIQCAMGFLVAAWVGPTLVAPDLANGALPLYFSRPLTRKEYVLGRLATLFLLLSAITWVPDLLLWLLQGALAGNGWMGENLRLARAIVLNAFVWILVVSLLALAISAWVKWRMVASGLLFGIFFVAAGFGQAVNLVLRTYWGSLLDISYLLKTVWTDLFDLPEVAARPRRWGAEVQDDIPTGIAWMALVVICTVCLAILNRRLRAREVVRG